MQKKIIISLILSTLSIAPLSAMAQETQQQYVEVSTEGKQTNVEPVGNVPSQEVNTVQESELARKAIQAEKARNAAENDKYGFAITIIAMGIVVLALLILSILFRIFGKISSSLQRSRKRKAHGVSVETADSHHEEEDSGEAIAAIALALAEHFGQGHDTEDTILTIRRMRKAYSPWNSKIYNLRAIPAHSEVRATRGLKK